MSEIDRAELRRLLDAATPRPWWQDWVEGDEFKATRDRSCAASAEGC